MFYARSLDIPVIWLLLYLYHQRHTYKHVSIIILLLYLQRRRHSQTSVLSLTTPKEPPTGCCTNTDNDICTTTCRAVPKRFWRSPTTPKEPPTGCCTNTDNDMCTNYSTKYMYSIKLCSVI